MEKKAAVEPVSVTRNNWSEVSNKKNPEFGSCWCPAPSSVSQAARSSTISVLDLISLQSEEKNLLTLNLFQKL